jgi:hypothetical protein
LPADLTVVNPYAPPAPPPAVVPEAVLPAGMRRFRLAPEQYRALVRGILIRRYLVIGLLYVLMLGLLWSLGLLVEFTIGIAVAAWIGSFVLSWLRTRAVVARQLVMFEIIMSARVLRRVMVGLPVAEVLRPEVTRIVETPRALCVVSTTPRRTMSVVRAVDGYEAVRAQVATWGTIESLRGWKAFAFAWGQLRHMRPRDRIEGALATDPTLGDELTAVRTVSRDGGGGYGGVVTIRKRIVWMLMLWCLLIFTFLAIWELLQPRDLPRPPRPPRPATSAPI